MRLRNNPNANNILNECKYVINEPELYKGKWLDVFDNNHPIHIEIGMGKGDFIIENAKKYSDINFIGIEKYPTVLASATSKLDDLELSNLKLIKADAINLKDIFDIHEIDQLYLNFSDAWPKNSHEKRRLTYKDFIDVYKVILKDNSHIIFKTDNRGLFEYSIISFNHYPLVINDICLDLHHSENYDNIETEYERKFSIYGPIYRIDVSFE